MLPYGQMSLWGIYLPQMYFLITQGVILIMVLNKNTDVILKKIKGMYRIGPHNENIMSIVHGSLLGDAHAEKRLGGLGTRISFYQEDTHLKYICYLHYLLSNAGYCNNNKPAVKTRLGSKGKVRKVLRFHTWTYTSFNVIRAEWYTNNKKCLPKNIDRYLTPLALAVWIMDDGAKVGKGMKFCTNNFTYKECVMLTSVLYIKFNLKATVQSAGAENQYIIYIWKESMKDLYCITNPYIIPEMKYKIT